MLPSKKRIKCPIILRKYGWCGILALVYVIRLEMQTTDPIHEIKLSNSVQEFKENQNHFVVNDVSSVELLHSIIPTKTNVSALAIHQPGVCLYRGNIYPESLAPKSRSVIRLGPVMRLQDACSMGHVTRDIAALAWMAMDGIVDGVTLENRCMGRDEKKSDLGKIWHGVLKFALNASLLLRPEEMVRAISFEELQAGAVVCSPRWYSGRDMRGPGGVLNWFKNNSNALVFRRRYFEVIRDSIGPIAYTEKNINKKVRVVLLTRPGQARDFVDREELLLQYRGMVSKDVELVVVAFGARNIVAIPLNQQVEIISSSSILILAHGAGSWHTLNLRAGSVCIEIFGPGYMYPMFAGLVQQVNAHWLPLLAPGVASSSYSLSKPHNPDFRFRNIRISAAQLYEHTSMAISLLNLLPS